MFGCEPTTRPRRGLPRQNVARLRDVAARQADPYVALTGAINDVIVLALAFLVHDQAALFATPSAAVPARDRSRRWCHNKSGHRKQH